jgi:hypothetical protein
MQLSCAHAPALTHQPACADASSWAVLHRACDGHTQVGGCNLTLLGWCCFSALLCVAAPLSFLPFICDGCKKKCQRPVYGYPMQNLAFITSAQDGAGWPAHKACGSGGVSSVSTSTAAPSIMCMDVSLVEMVQQGKAADQLPGTQQQQQQQQHHVRSPERQGLLIQAVRCTPSPPPLSIFVPPSAVPACEFLWHACWHACAERAVRACAHEPIPVACHMRGCAHAHVFACPAPP